MTDLENCVDRVRTCGGWYCRKTDKDCDYLNRSVMCCDGIDYIMYGCMLEERFINHKKFHRRRIL